jgi:pimeloyl-ACP methyl ester carboxylesterase
MPDPEKGEYSLNLIATDVFELLDHLKIKKANFIGCSFGAILIRIMEEMQPNRFISIAMSGAVLRLKSSIYYVFKLGKILAPVINNHFLYSVMAYFIMPRKNHSQPRKVFITQAKLIDPHEYKNWLVILENVKRKLDVIFEEPFRSPTILLMGDQDHAFLSDSKKYCRKHPQTKLEIIKHCGHVSNIEKYQVFNTLALEFIKNNNQ